MKALTIHQPWATLLALGFKAWETRGWATTYRGPVMIHAGLEWTKLQRQLLQGQPFSQRLHTIPLRWVEPCPRGAVLALADLEQCIEITPPWARRVGPTDEGAYGDWTPGRYAWRLRVLHILQEPIQWKGHQGLWVPPDELLDAYSSQTQGPGHE